ncbi:MAG: preprotein translocase subunit YajC [Gallionella sp.]|nr:preprotein translocase subunit YajC [Gallionella sp.]
MFISNAFADSGTQPQGGLLEQVMFFAPIVLLAAYMIYSQFKRAKQHKTMTDALQRGDEIITIGGQLARITKIYDEYIAIELSDNIEVFIQKQAIQTVLPKGTIKAIK